MHVHAAATVCAPVRPRAKYRRLLFAVPQRYYISERLTNNDHGMAGLYTAFALRYVHSRGTSHHSEILACLDSSLNWRPYSILEASLAKTLYIRSTSQLACSPFSPVVHIICSQRLSASVAHNVRV